MMLVGSPVQRRTSTSNKAPPVVEWNVLERIRLMELFRDGDLLWDQRVADLKAKFPKRPEEFFTVRSAKDQTNYIFSKPNPELDLQSLDSTIHPRSKESAALWIQHFQKELHRKRYIAKQNMLIAMRKVLDVIRRYQRGELPQEEMDALLQREIEKDKQRPNAEEHERKIQEVRARIPNPEDIKNVRTVVDLLKLLHGERIPPPPPEFDVEPGIKRRTGIPLTPAFIEPMECAIIRVHEQEAAEQERRAKEEEIEALFEEAEKEPEVEEVPPQVVSPPAVVKKPVQKEVPAEPVKKQKPLPAVAPVVKPKGVQAIPAIAVEDSPKTDGIPEKEKEEEKEAFAPRVLPKDQLLTVETASLGGEEEAVAAVGKRRRRQRHSETQQQVSPRARSGPQRTCAVVAEVRNAAAASSGVQRARHVSLQSAISPVQHTQQQQTPVLAALEEGEKSPPPPTPAPQILVSPSITVAEEERVEKEELEKANVVPITEAKAEREEEVEKPVETPPVVTTAVAIESGGRKKGGKAPLEPEEVEPVEEEEEVVEVEQPELTVTEAPKTRRRRRRAEELMMLDKAIVKRTPTTEKEKPPAAVILLEEGEPAAKRPRTRHFTERIQLKTPEPVPKKTSLLSQSLAALEAPTTSRGRLRQRQLSETSAGSTPVVPPPVTLPAVKEVEKLVAVADEIDAETAAAQIEEILEEEEREAEEERRRSISSSTSSSVTRIAITPKPPVTRTRSVTAKRAPEVKTPVVEEEEEEEEEMEMVPKKLPAVDLRKVKREKQQFISGFESEEKTPSNSPPKRAPPKKQQPQQKVATAITGEESSGGGSPKERVFPEIDSLIPSPPSKVLSPRGVSKTTTVLAAVPPPVPVAPPPTISTKRPQKVAIPQQPLPPQISITSSQQQQQQQNLVLPQRPSSMALSPMEAVGSIQKQLLHQQQQKRPPPKRGAVVHTSAAAISPAAPTTTKKIVSVVKKEVAPKAPPSEVSGPPPSPPPSRPASLSRKGSTASTRSSSLLLKEVVEGEKKKSRKQQRTPPPSSLEQEIIESPPPLLVRADISHEEQQEEEDEKVKQGEQEEEVVVVEEENVIKRRATDEQKSRFRDEPVQAETLLILLDSIMEHRCTPYFLSPVELTVPGYRDAIKQPMDLSTMRRMIEAGTIHTYGQMKNALILMFANAVIFNQDWSVYNQGAKEMLAASLRKIHEAQFPQGTLGVLGETGEFMGEGGSGKRRTRPSNRLRDSPGGEFPFVSPSSVLGASGGAKGARSGIIKPFLVLGSGSKSGAQTPGSIQSRPSFTSYLVVNQGSMRLHHQTPDSVLAMSGIDGSGGGSPLFRSPKCEPKDETSPSSSSTSLLAPPPRTVRLVSDVSFGEQSRRLFVRQPSQNERLHHRVVFPERFSMGPLKVETGEQWETSAARSSRAPSTVSALSTSKLTSPTPSTVSQASDRFGGTEQQHETGRFVLPAAKKGGFKKEKE